MTGLRSSWARHVVRAGTGFVVAAALAGCAVANAQHGRPNHGEAHHRVALDPRLSSDALVLHGHPQAIEPLAGVASGAGGSGVTATAGVVSVSAGANGSNGASGANPPLQQPISNQQVEAELAASGISADPNRATLISGGLALPPIDAPAQVQAVINAGNEIARLPYIWGGGHLTYEDTGYDCSGSLSFVLAAAGLLTGTETSGQLESYGDPGPGRWITIFANAGHTFAYIAGLRFDTVALAETGSRWSNRKADESNLSSFVVRHPPGL